VAWTLQTGRDPMEERLGFVVRSIDELAEKLDAYLRGEQGIAGAHRGRVESAEDGMTAGGEERQIDEWIAGGKLEQLLELWVRGLSFDWNRLHAGVKPRRISLPAYPFARERHWIDAMSFDPGQDDPLAAGADMQAIDDILSKLDEDMMDSEQAVEALKMLV
jgi:acyl transferase domain-containing protein